MAGIFDFIKSLLFPKSGELQVSYSSNGRSGYVHCRGEGLNLDLYYEFGGGDVVASIDVPSPKKWTKQTGLPVESRMPLLEAIARQVVKDQTTMGRGRFEVEDNWIVIRG